jgi:hypothetical protein
LLAFVQSLVALSSAKTSMKVKIRMEYFHTNNTKYFNLCLTENAVRDHMVCEELI